jgi:hypothetical protein
MSLSTLTIMLLVPFIGGYGVNMGVAGSSGPQASRLTQTISMVQQWGDKTFACLIGGASDEVVHFILGDPNLQFGPCGMQTATAIASRRPTDLRKSEAYLRRWGLLSISYQCDSHFVWRVTEVEFRAFR